MLWPEVGTDAQRISFSNHKFTQRNLSYANAKLQDKNNMEANAKLRDIKNLQKLTLPQET